MSNLIDRQTVIDALEKVAELFPWRVPGNRDSYDRYNEAWNDAIGRAEIEIEKLPSAQPEQAIKDCRNCKHGKYNDHLETHFCYNPNECTEWNLWEPIAQPEPKAGKWSEKEVLRKSKAGTVIEEWQSCKCSVCGRYDTRPYLYYFDEPHFCSWCGARMVKEGDEHD